MITRLIAPLAAVAALAAFAAGPATAETTSECMKATFDVAKGAQSKSPSEAQIEKLDAALSKIEGLCTEKKFAEADSERKALAEMVAQM